MADTRMDGDLAKWIDAQPIALGEDWVRALDDRKREEAEFHDVDRAGHRDEDRSSTSNRRFYEATAPVRRHIEKWISTYASQATFLDYACGNGLKTVEAAMAGARLAVGIDISETSVRNAQETATRAGVADCTRFLQRDCEANPASV